MIVFRATIAQERTSCDAISTLLVIYTNTMTLSHKNNAHQGVFSADDYILSPSEAFVSSSKNSSVSGEH
jgi:hypothetical protein